MISASSLGDFSLDHHSATPDDQSEYYEVGNLTCGKPQILSSNGSCTQFANLIVALYDVDIDSGCDSTWVQCDAHLVKSKPNNNLVQCVAQLWVDYADHGSFLGVLVRDYIPPQFTMKNGLKLKKEYRVFSLFMSGRIYILVQGFRKMVVDTCIICRVQQTSSNIMQPVHALKLESSKDASLLQHMQIGWLGQQLCRSKRQRQSTEIKWVF
ncbi:hypothetical protein MTR_3g061990 [Medicago truncatula]|uniref:Uncharacterized protein n=1 Tax=Medicago truncatula TaxID=3880 RepID=G7J294_MEDTR|nr:hypothetical protein MTR_3g061990 [Medicago truncatula]